MDLRHVKDKLVHADVDGGEFEKKWEKLGWYIRFGIPILAPFIGLYMRCFGTRKDIVKYSALSLKKSQEEILTYNEKLEEFETIILDWRDQHLINVIEKQRKKHNNKRVKIGILYGASHMRAVIYYLSNLRNPQYTITKSEWMTVMKP